MKKSLFLWAIFIAVSFLGISSTFACSCMMNSSPEEASENYSNIFIWDVVEVNESNISEEWLWEMSQNTVRINVENSVKWQNGDVMVVQTSQSSASCGYNFEEWEKYIVYSDNRWEEDGDLNVSLCSRTALVENAQEDLEAFWIEWYENQTQEVTTTSTWTDDQTDTWSEVDEEETNTWSLDEDNNQEDEDSIMDEITDPSDTNQNIFYIILLLLVITLAIVIVTNKSKEK